MANTLQRAPIFRLVAVAAIATGAALHGDTFDFAQCRRRAALTKTDPRELSQLIEVRPQR